MNLLHFNSLKIILRTILIIVILLFLCFRTTNILAQEAVSLVTIDDATLQDVVLDDYGNKYVLFNSSADSIRMNGSLVFTKAPCAEGLFCADNYVVAIDRNSNILFRKQFWGNSRLFDVDISDSTLLISGWFFNDSLLSTDVCFVLDAPPGGDNLFFIKYDLRGELLAAKQFPASTKYDCRWLLSSLMDDKVLFAGEYYDTLSLDSLILPDLVGGFHDTNGFVGVLDDDMQVQWIHRIGGADFDGVTGISYDYSGNVVVTGNFSSFDLRIDAVSTGLSSAGAITEIFLMKFDEFGTPIWQRQVRDPNPDFALSIEISDDNSIFLPGSYEGWQADFGDTIIDNPASAWNGFLAKYTPEGSIDWVEQFDADLAALVFDSDINADGNIWLTGYFEADNQLGIGDYTFEQPGNGPDIFIVKYSPEGDVLYANVFGGAGTDNSYEIHSVGNHRVLFAGRTTSPILPIMGDTIFNLEGKSNIFIVEIEDPSVSTVRLPVLQCTVPISPNPASPGDRLSIHLNDCNNISSASSLRLLNSAGSVVYHAVLDGALDDVFVPDVPAGVYFLEITDGTVRAGGKLVVVRR